MLSFLQKIDNRRATYLNLVSSVESQLRDAYARLHESGLENQTSLAKKLGVGRSAINRRLTGKKNMTLETVADMVWALGASISVKIEDQAVPSDKNFYLSLPTPPSAQPIKVDMVTMIGRNKAPASRLLSASPIVDWKETVI